MTQHYSPKQFRASWREFTKMGAGGGISEGTFMDAVHTVRQYSMNTGGDGGTTFIESPDTSGTVTITYRMGSPLLAGLTAAALSNINRQDGLVVAGTLTILDGSGESAVLAEDAVMDGPPDLSLATDEGDVPITWLCSNLIIENKGGKELRAVTTTQVPI